MNGSDTMKNRHAMRIAAAALISGLAPAWAQMDHGSMQGGSPPPDARDPHAYSDGLTLPPDRPLKLMDESSMGSLMVDRLESVRTRDDTTGAFELQARYGRDYDRAVLKAEGHVADGDLEEASTELLWSHAVAAYWDTQLGVRHDSGEDRPGRNWLAFGFEGLAPYWFEIDATAYVGESGRSAFRFSAEYELLFTQRLVLQPRLEANFYGKRDEELGTGTGLSDAVAGVRLRYEFKREFAPYIGVEYAALYGETADMAKAAGKDSSETRWVAGLRFWF
jgi:copper resistance protein B